MRTSVGVFWVIVLVLGIGPGWTGDERLALLGSRAQLDAEQVTLAPDDPRRIRVGRLTFLGGVALTSRDPAFGGFSALAVQSTRFTLLSDGGNIVRFTMGSDWRPRGIAFANLPAGPLTGWEKRDRDSESLAIDPVTGRTWVGFENANAIWRYGAGLTWAETQVRPAEMSRWSPDGGAELLTRLPDGRFLAVSESTRVPGSAWRGGTPARRRTRDAILFSGDPTAPETRSARLGYVPEAGFNPVDAAALPGGDLIVLERRFALPFRWSNRLSIVPATAVRPGRLMRGMPIATLEAPLLHDNFEGLAVTAEGSSTILWLVSDDNQWSLQRSLLLKFRLDR